VVLKGRVVARDRGRTSAKIHDMTGKDLLLVKARSLRTLLIKQAHSMIQGGNRLYQRYQSLPLVGFHRKLHRANDLVPPTPTKLLLRGKRNYRN